MCRDFCWEASPELRVCRHAHTHTHTVSLSLQQPQYLNEPWFLLRKFYPVAQHFTL